MKTSSIDNHLGADSPPTDYIALRTLDSLALEARWRKEEGLIKQVLCSTLPDTAFNRIKATATVKAAWDILKRVYEDCLKALVADVMRRFRNKCCKEDKSICEHFESLADLREQLAAMGKAISNEDYTDTLLASLPATYNTTVSSISVSACLGSKTLTAEIFEQLVINEYEQRQAKDKRMDTKDKALSADSDKRGRKGKGKGKCGTLECYNCGKKGHYKSECWAKGGGDEGGGLRRGKSSKEDASQAKNQKNKPEAWAAIEVMDGPAGEAASNATTGHTQGHVPMQADHPTPGRTCELYDSGAMCHMLPYHEHFKAYHAIPLRTITAADKRVFYAIGIGDLEIEVPNGMSSTLITLKDVLHAPDMGITIVSINCITKAGYSITFDIDACQIWDKSDKVIGTIPASQNGLYKVEKAYAAAIPEECIDLRLLHQHLTHISPNAIHKMVKSGTIAGIELVDDGSVLICKACEQAKTTWKQI